MPLDYSQMVLDVVSDVRANTPFEKAIRDVAADYEADENVLAARVARAFPNGISPTVSIGAKVEFAVAQLCRQHNVPRDRVIGPIRATVGRTVMAIARQGQFVLSVDIETAEVRRIGAGAFTDAALRFATSKKDA